MKASSIWCRGRGSLVMSVLALLAGLAAPVGAAAKPVRPKTAVASMPQIRLVSISTPVPLARVQNARRPIRIGTVNYVLGDYPTSYDVLASGAYNGGISWSVVQPGRGQARWSGIVPAAKVRALAGGSVCVVVQSGSRAQRVAPGEQRFPLFYQFSPEHRAMLLVTPAPLPATPMRTAFAIAAKTELPEPKSPKQLKGGGPPMGGPGMGGHGGAIKWQRGAKGYEAAMREHDAKKSKPVAIFFSDPKSMECRRLDSEVFSACRAQEVLARAIPVKISPDQGPAEKALAARFGVKAYPSFIVIPAKSSQPKWVLPDSGKVKPKGGQGAGGGSMPCHVTDLISMAIAGK